LRVTFCLILGLASTEFDQDEYEGLGQVGLV